MWGTSPPNAPAKPREKLPKRPLNPASVKAGHQGIAWLHVTGVAIWTLVALVFGGLLLAGRDVPPVLLIAAIGAGAAHGLFLLTHVWLARAAARKIRASQGG
jgi:hypothetical protein